MIDENFEKFTISQGAILIKDDKCLIGEFAPSPGLWGLPGGRIDKKEDSITAFKRELREEINLKNFKIVELVFFNVWYKNNIPRSSIIFLIDAEVKDIKAGDEFLQLKWISEKDIGKYNFYSPNIKSAIKKGFKIIKEKNIQT